MAIRTYSNKTIPRFIVVHLLVLASGHICSSWWKMSLPRTSTKVWIFDYNVITRIPPNYPSSSIPMQPLPQSSNTLWNWYFLMSSNPQPPVQSLKLFTRTLLCSIRWLDPLQHKKFRKNPQYPWRWNEYPLKHST